MHLLSAEFTMPLQKAIGMKFNGTLEESIYERLAEKLVKELINSKTIHVDQYQLSPSPHNPYAEQTMLFRATVYVQNPKNLKA